MAKEIVLVDDMDGSRADETVRFALDGQDYEIDFNAKNAEAFRTALEKYVRVARPVQAETPRRRRGRARDYDIEALRRWAEANDVKLPRRGRIPADIVERFKHETKVDVR